MQADPQDIRRAAGIFKALSHPSRLKIVCLLFDGRCRTQKELVEELSRPQSTTARHLSHLREKGLVSVTRQGIVEDNTINTHILHIRKKFKKVDPDFDCIKTRYGFGYSWICR